jgi:pyrophosphatase PpaX
MNTVKRKPDTGSYRALLTDLDGTLIHSQDAICSALFESFAHVGARVPEKEAILGMFGLPVEVMLTELGGVDRNEIDQIAEFIAEYKRQYPVHMRTGASLIKNAKETMDAIAAAGFPICLITSERRQNAQFILKNLDLDRSVRFLISRDDVTRFKPDPEPLQNAIKLLGQIPGECVYVGESPFDIQAGVASGVYVAAVGSGNWSVQSLLECDPDVMLNDISELAQLFGLHTA